MSFIFDTVRSSSAGTTDQRVLAWVLNTPAPASVSDRLVALSKQLTTLEDCMHSFTVRPPPRKKPPRRQRREEDANGGVTAASEETAKDISTQETPSTGSTSLPATPHGTSAALISLQQDQSPQHPLKEVIFSFYWIN